MADEQAPATTPVPEAKKKRRVKRGAPVGNDVRAYFDAKIAAEVKAAAAAPPDPPARRAKLTMKDRQHYDYIREATMKNVWCVWFVLAVICLAG